MKLLTSKTSGNYASKGFTLIELLVVITILAILSVIGLITYSSVRANARDAIRRNVINTVASAIEANRDAVAGVYKFTATQLSAEFPNDAYAAIGYDPQNNRYDYCLGTSTSSTTPPTAPINSQWLNADNSWWPPSLTCQTVNGTGFTGASGSTYALSYEVNTPSDSVTISSGDVKSWTLCAKLEGNSIFCRSSLTR